LRPDGSFVTPQVRIAPPAIRIKLSGMPIGTVLPDLRRG
jgi:hypothetical protein